MRSSGNRVRATAQGIAFNFGRILAGVGAIVFDEFHERHLAGDLGAVLALDVQATLRPGLRLLVMSATLDGERIAQWLDAPRLSSPGRSFPVRIEHPPARAQESVEQHLARVARQALQENDGDVLAFLPGRREIARAQSILVQSLADDVEVLALHGELSLVEQQSALAPAESGLPKLAEVRRLRAVDDKPDEKVG